MSLHFTPNDPEPNACKTKAAKAILRVTGPNNNLVELDFLRQELKAFWHWQGRVWEYAMLLKQLHDGLWNTPNTILYKHEKILIALLKLHNSFVSAFWSFLKVFVSVTRELLFNACSTSAKL